jgi:hypothetical protein
MHKLDTRVTLFGLVTLVFAVASAFACVAFALASLGIGTLVAFAPDGSFGFGAALGAFGTVAALIGLVVAAVQAFAGLLVLRGRTLGLVLGFIFAGLAVMSGVGADFDLMTLGYGLFGVWALWTSRAQFR